jgi:Transcriptional regulator PadR-like family
MAREKTTRDLFPGALEMMVLQTLRRAPMHGYALAQVIKQNSEDLLQIEEGSLYPALQRMDSLGTKSPRACLLDHARGSPPAREEGFLLRADAGRDLAGHEGVGVVTGRRS